jgi:hypothetical protein
MRLRVVCMAVTYTPHLRCAIFDTGRPKRQGNGRCPSSHGVRVSIEAGTPAANMVRTTVTYTPF